MTLEQIQQKLASAQDLARSLQGLQADALRAKLNELGDTVGEHAADLEDRLKAKYGKAWLAAAGGFIAGAAAATFVAWLS